MRRPSSILLQWLHENQPRTSKRRCYNIKGLTAGVLYTLQLCAIGGSTGAGDWSDPVSHMAM
jgi:hypothetical protein